MSAAEDLEEFYVHTVTVDVVTGGGPWGDEVTTSDPLRCFVDDSRSFVRDSNGVEVVSSTTITAPPEYRENFTPGTTVHLPHRDAQVIAVAVADSAALDLPDHIEVALT